MKKLILGIAIIMLIGNFASAQILPTLQFGVKAGLDVTSLQASSSATFSTSNRAGYLAGIWLRVGAVGFNFQPEMYITSKDAQVSNNAGGTTTARFTSLDVPLLFGGKIGAFGLGGRFYTGPVIGFAINKNQSFGGALDKATSLDYQDQNFAWQFGVGVDVRKISVDLRLEQGITKQAYGYNHTRIGLFNISLAYSLAKI